MTEGSDSGIIVEDGCASFLPLVRALQ